MKKLLYFAKGQCVTVYMSGMCKGKWVHRKKLHTYLRNVWYKNVNKNGELLCYQKSHFFVLCNYLQTYYLHYLR